MLLQEEGERTILKCARNSTPKKTCSQQAIFSEPKLLEFYQNLTDLGEGKYSTPACSSLSHGGKEIQLALCIYQFHIHEFNQLQIEIFFLIQKIPEAKLDPLLYSSNYLHCIYIVFTTIYRTLLCIRY